jgi:hypothetical protein
VHHLGHLKGMDQCVQDSIQQRRVDGSDLSSPRRLPIGRRVILSSVDRGMDALDSIGDDREDTGPIAILGFELQSDDSLCLCKQSMNESSAMQARVVKEMRGNTGQDRAGLACSPSQHELRGRFVSPSNQCLRRIGRSPYQRAPGDQAGGPHWQSYDLAQWSRENIKPLEDDESALDEMLSRESASVSRGLSR